MAMVTFDDQGKVINVLRFGTERHGDAMAVGAEVSSDTWHTVIALEPGCVLLEVKAGPFDPNQPKDLAPWAPEEDSVEAQDYFDQKVELIAKRLLRDDIKR
jgi:cupin fold WbuC family metalloprotein